MLHFAPSNTLARTVVAALAVASALSAGCRGSSGGYNGDQPSIPPANKYGSGSPISSYLHGKCLAGTCSGNAKTCKQDADCEGFFGPSVGWVDFTNIDSTNCNYPPPYQEFVPGVTVTAVDRFDETGNGAVGTVYVQDTVGLNDWTQIPKYAGTQMYDPSFSPPDLRVLPGDVLDLTGQYEEFPGPSTTIFQNCETLPQIAGSASFRFDGQVPPPVQIEPKDLATYESARAYESMLVTVNNVTIGANPTITSGRYGVNIQVDGTQWQISNELFDVPGNIALAQNQQFKSITGIVTFFFGYHLAPRSLDDFNPHGPSLMMDAGTGGSPPSTDGGADAGDGGTDSGTDGG